MKILRVEHYQGTYVETNDPALPQYRRALSGRWEVRRGKAWDSVRREDQERLEKMYVEYITRNHYDIPF